MNPSFSIEIEQKEFTLSDHQAILKKRQKKIMKNTQLLNKILTKSTSTGLIGAETSCSICVFDLDSTLFNVSPRTEQILKEFAEANQWPRFSKIKVHPKDWGLKEIMIREGYDFNEASPENLNLHKQLVAFWSEKFFTNQYLEFDTPYLGAVHFVQTLFAKNIDIHYLTGRDIQRMGSGTDRVLRKWGFPILTPAHLHLKPNKDLDDHQFKLDWVIDFKKKYKNSRIFFFENEPVNINAIGAAVPDIEIVYLNTTHSRRGIVNVPVTEIDDFNLEKSF